MTEHTHGSETVERLNRFSDAAEAQHMELLNAVEQTMNALASGRRHVSILVDHGELLIELLNSAHDKLPLDPPDEIVPRFEQLEDGLRSSALPNLRARRDSARTDPRIAGDMGDGIVSAYDDLISLVARFHDTLVELRWAVMEHDADLDEPTGNVYESPEDLIKALRS